MTKVQKKRLELLTNLIYEAKLYGAEVAKDGFCSRPEDFNNAITDIVHNLGLDDVCKIINGDIYYDACGGAD